MSKIVFDTDGLIKLVRSGIFQQIRHDCIISERVYEEAVVAGKKRLYGDAYQIERFIHEGKIQVRKVRVKTAIPGLGKGELSAMDCFKQINADVIVSDDRKFLSVLEEKGIPFVVPTECIVALVAAKKIQEKEGLEALENIKEFVSKENYERAVEALGGKL
ncbi:MAG: hypothetical protein NTW67_04215 [Candidatus Woesearchaeota archaeon]|nr:hypothetical protein [Candidatus Woesearchaeota archaeon]